MDDKLNSNRKTGHVVPTVQRTFEILEALAQSPTGAGVSELSRELGIAKSTTHSILSSLEVLGYAYKTDSDGRYQLTLKLHSLSGPVVNRLDLRQLALPVLQQLGERTGEAINLGTLQGDEAVYIECIQSRHPVTVHTWPGERLALHSTALGKVLLAWLPGDFVTELLSKKGMPPRTANTITSLAAFEQELGLVRAQGYALDREEDVIGSQCIGVPIQDHTQRVVAAVSLTAPMQRMSAHTTAQLVPVLLDAAQQISIRLGCRITSAKVKDSAL
jgi:DNA-binding IclR family transcriptional regulator